MCTDRPACNLSVHTHVFSVKLGSGLDLEHFLKFIIGDDS